MPPKNSRKKTARHLTNQVRIIGGDWRGRKLPFPDIPGLRPTGDRMRETLFNWLAPHIYQSRVLDLFAGSGVLGLEALSRGAKHCVFVELNKEAVGQLIRNLEALQCGRATVLHQDAFATMDTLTGSSIDLLLLDPPFDAHWHEKVLKHAQEQQILAENALVYIESPVNEAFAIPSNWSLYKQKTSGQVQYSLYQACPHN